MEVRMLAAFYDSLDDALASLSDYGSGLANGNFNHAPMVAEALCVMGRPEAVMPWLEGYRPRMLPLGPPGQRVRPERRQEAPGPRRSFSAWAEFFAEEPAGAYRPAGIDSS